MLKLVDGEGDADGDIDPVVHPREDVRRTVGPCLPLPLALPGLALRLLFALDFLLTALVSLV